MNDKFVVRVVVVGLAAIVVACIVAAVVLSLAGEDFPEFLKYVGTTALGAFGGILAKTGTDVQPVAVVGQPVETTEVAPKQRRKRGDVGAITLEGILVALVILAAAIWLGAAIHPLFFLLLLLLVFLVLA